MAKPKAGRELAYSTKHPVTYLLYLPQFVPYLTYTVKFTLRLVFLPLGNKNTNVKNELKCTREKCFSSHIGKKPLTIPYFPCCNRTCLEREWTPPCYTNFSYVTSQLKRKVPIHWLTSCPSNFGVQLVARHDICADVLLGWRAVSCNVIVMVIGDLGHLK